MRIIAALPCGRKEIIHKVSRNLLTSEATKGWISLFNTLLRSGGNLHHATFGNPTAAVNLFLIGKQYLTLLQAKAAVTRNLIGRKLISNVKRSDTRNALPTVAFVKVD